MRATLFPIIVTLGALGLSTSAYAGSSTGTMAVTSAVLTNCTVAATPMAFGTLLALGTGNIDSTATVTLICTPNATYDLLMDDGANVSGGVRRMKHFLNSEYIPYGVFRDAAHALPWSNTTTTRVNGTASAIGLATHTAYGRIPSTAASVSAGAFVDTVTVTVEF